MNNKPTEAMIRAEMALCKEAVRHCMNGSGLQNINHSIWKQFATALLKLRPQEALAVTLLNDELFDPSTSPSAEKSANYFEAWQDGYDAALNRVLERLQGQQS